MAVPAFSGAQGFGSTTPGGRGGRVIEVTNLNDAGPGSFREAVTATGPRIVTPKVAGTITLLSPVKVKTPFLTISGSTAPGMGICLKADPSYKNECLGIETHDVVVRHIRSRPGPSTALSESRRALVIRFGAYNVIVDHCSFSWSTDETVTIIDGCHDITVSWCFITEPLNKSTHVKGAHSKAVSISGKSDDPAHPSVERVSFHHNLIAHSRDRNPNPACQGLVDVVNNVIYNFGDRATNVSDLQATVPVNYINNVVKKGPQSSAAYELMLTETGTGNEAALFVKGNIGPHRPDISLADNLVVDPQDRGLIVPTRFAAPGVLTTSAAQAFIDVLAKAGCNKVRDAVDTRIVNEVQNGTGKVIDDPSQVGAWPVLA